MYILSMRRLLAVHFNSNREARLDDKVMPVMVRVNERANMTGYIGARTIKYNAGVLQRY